MSTSEVMVSRRNSPTRSMIAGATSTKKAGREMRADRMRAPATTLMAERLLRPGVGLATMNERASMLGGTLVAGPTSRGGVVHAVLPVVDLPLTP